MKKTKRNIVKILIVLFVIVGGYGAYTGVGAYMEEQGLVQIEVEKVAPGEVLEYTGEAYTVINGNNPDFSKADIARLSMPGYEYYSALDSLGRCGYAEACVGPETRPTEDRESISSVEPAGYQSLKFDSVSGGWLWNRGHLIAFTLTGENANDHNLVTLSSYANQDTMVDFELGVAEYIESTGNHVAYRSTPIYKGDELVPRGILLEAYSVEDKGESICFNVYIHNVQPNIEIDYTTGEAWEVVD